MKKIVVLMVLFSIVVLAQQNESFTDEYETLKKRGVVYFKKGNYDRAIEDFSVALRIKPKGQDALSLHFLRGSAYGQVGNYEKAIEDFSAVLRIDPDDQDALYNRGITYYDNGNYDKATKDLETLLKINPNDTDVSEYLEKIRKSKTEAKNNIKFLTDNRDGKKYKIVTIGNQIWMAENLSYNVKGSKCYNNNFANCQQYGRLYNWNSAMKACPRGWHLPSDAEWATLITMVGGKEIGGKFLKATSGWNDGFPGTTGNGTDAYGFLALPGGYGDSDGSFSSVGSFGVWWSSSDVSASNAYIWTMSHIMAYVGPLSPDKSRLNSVRCVQD